MDMKTDKQPSATTRNILTGQFFHSLGSDGQIHWQGYIVGSPEPGWYLAQLYSWLDGEPHLRRLVPLSEMKDWLFYGSAEAMSFSYEHGIACKGGQYRK
jgi:hypothetical protein